MDINKMLAKPNETIRQHTDKLIKQAKLLNQLGYISSQTLYSDLLCACEYHDYGKGNSEFQKRIVRHYRFNSYKEIPHSVLSVFFVDESKCNDYAGEGNSKKLEDLKKQLDNYVIYATSDGVVSSLDVTQGLSIDDISIPIATISNENTINVIVYISDADIFDVKTDMTAKISVSGNSKLTEVGTITKISSVKDVENKGYKTVISVKNPDALKIGMSVNVSIFSLIEKNVLSLNSEALINYGEDGYKVFVLQKNNDGTYKIVKKIIKCEWINSEYVKFLSDPDFDILNEGDYVVAEPAYYEEGIVVLDIKVIDEE